MLNCFISLYVLFGRYLKHSLVDEELLSMKNFQEYIPSDRAASASLSEDEISEEFAHKKHMVSCYHFAKCLNHFKSYLNNLTLYFCCFFAPTKLGLILSTLQLQMYNP